jgi:chromosome segregation ATPase
MPEFKSPTSRLARLFRQSRDQWKQRAAEKQKKLRALEIKVRDLRESRDRWKQQAQNAQQELRDLNAQVHTEQKKGLSSLTSL